MRREPWMGCCSAVSTDFQHSLTTERLPRDCGLSRTPSLPDRSILSTGPPCVPSHPRYGHTDLVRAAKQIRISCKSLNEKKINNQICEYFIEANGKYVLLERIIETSFVT